jgi:hypothetical protein
VSCILNRWPLALYVSTGTILLFAHGFVAARFLFTVAFIVGSTLALFSSSRSGNFTIDCCDLLFGMFICCVTICYAVNNFFSDSKSPLFVLSFSTYRSARVLEDVRQ